jgi:hypothetical protein
MLMEKDYKGVIIEESLDEPLLINKLDIVEFEITRGENQDDPTQLWHLYTVNVSKEDIEGLSKQIKPKWYMHFWKGRDIVVVFRGRTFEFDYDDKPAWKPAVDYGRSLGIPEHQLNFPID